MSGSSGAPRSRLRLRDRLQASAQDPLEAQARSAHPRSHRRGSVRRHSVDGQALGAGAAPPAQCAVAALPTPAGVARRGSTERSLFAGPVTPPGGGLESVGRPLGRLRFCRFLAVYRYRIAFGGISPAEIGTKGARRARRRPHFPRTCQRRPRPGPSDLPGPPPKTFWRVAPKDPGPRGVVTKGGRGRQHFGANGSGSKGEGQEAIPGRRLTATRRFKPCRTKSLSSRSGSFARSSSKELSVRPKSESCRELFKGRPQLSSGRS